MKREGETYLGDGLYASFDGFSFWLRAPRDGIDHVVCLEPFVLKAFDEFRKSALASMAAQQKQQQPPHGD